MLYLWHVTVKYPFDMAKIFRRQHPMSSDINSKNSSHQLFICRPIFFLKSFEPTFPYEPHGTLGKQEKTNTQRQRRTSVARQGGIYSKGNFWRRSGPVLYLDCSYLPHTSVKTHRTLCQKECL